MGSEGLPKEVLKKEEITVGGKKAIKEIATSLVVGALPAGIEEGNPISVYLIKDNYIIQINYTGREPDYSGNLANVEHLLDSFKLN